ncbi:hypothetical protein EV360DRAFT_72332 [Lentinula raphanica]|nr:hypothetical protein EV360DRAFT_72332 [Lentinula raphanica]
MLGNFMPEYNFIVIFFGTGLHQKCGVLLVMIIFVLGRLDFWARSFGYVAIGLRRHLPASASFEQFNGADLNEMTTFKLPPRCKAHSRAPDNRARTLIENWSDLAIIVRTDVAKFPSRIVRTWGPSISNAAECRSVPPILRPKIGPNSTTLCANGAEAPPAATIIVFQHMHSEHSEPKMRLTRVGRLPKNTKRIVRFSDAVLRPYFHNNLDTRDARGSSTDFLLRFSWAQQNIAHPSPPSQQNQYLSKGGSLNLYNFVLVVRSIRR